MNLWKARLQMLTGENLQQQHDVKKLQTYFKSKYAQSARNKRCRSEMSWHHNFELVIWPYFGFGIFWVLWNFGFGMVTLMVLVLFNWLGCGCGPRSQSLNTKEKRSKNWPNIGIEPSARKKKLTKINNLHHYLESSPVLKFTTNLELSSRERLKKYDLYLYSLFFGFDWM